MLLLLVEDQDLATTKLGAVAGPARPGAVEQLVRDRQSQLADPAQLHPQSRWAIARGEGIAGQRVDRGRRDEGSALVAEPGLRADPAQRDHRARQHPQSGAGPGPAADGDQSAPHPGARLLARVTANHDLATGHADADPRVGAAQPGARIARDPHQPAGQFGARPGSGVAAHLELAAAHARADVVAAGSLHDHAAAGHAGADPIHPPQVADDRRLIVAAAGHLEQIADGNHLSAAAHSQGGHFGRREPLQPLRGERAHRHPCRWLGPERERQRHGGSHSSVSGK